MDVACTRADCSSHGTASGNRADGCSCSCDLGYGERTLVAEEGIEVSSNEVGVSVATCKQRCSETVACNSFAYCEDTSNGCYLKDKVIDANEAAHPSKPQCKVAAAGPSNQHRQHAHASIHTSTSTQLSTSA